MMNDRFKFRVWAKPHEPTRTEGYYIDDADYMVMRPDGEVEICYYVDNGYDGSVDSFEQDEIVIEQCTGLKDRNGKLIFEGDIIELTRSRNYGWCRKGRKLKVQWNTFNCCGFGFGAIGNLTSKCAENCVVIGNIHENPELLEQSNDD